MRRPLPSPALIVALAALTVSMTGSAIAAQRYLITSTKQISPKVLRKLQGHTGATGATGSAGIQGEPGATGPAGTAAGVDLAALTTRGVTQQGPAPYSLGGAGSTLASVTVDVGSGPRPVLILADEEFYGGASPCQMFIRLNWDGIARAGTESVQSTPGAGGFGNGLGSLMTTATCSKSPR